MPRAPRTPCTAPGCPNLRPCAVHPVKAWRRSSARPARTNLSGSAEQARAQRVIRRDRCICYVCGKPGADEADHVIAVTDGGRDDESNMAAIHGKPCHLRKTAEEAARARARRPAN